MLVDRRRFLASTLAAISAAALGPRQLVAPGMASPSGVVPIAIIHKRSPKRYHLMLAAWDMRMGPPPEGWHIRDVILPTGKTAPSIMPMSEEAAKLAMKELPVDEPLDIVQAHCRGAFHDTLRGWKS